MSGVCTGGRRAARTHLACLQGAHHVGFTPRFIWRLQGATQLFSSVTDGSKAPTRFYVPGDRDPRAHTSHNGADDGTGVMPARSLRLALLLGGGFRRRVVVAVAQYLVRATPAEGRHQARLSCADGLALAMTCVSETAIFYYAGSIQGRLGIGGCVHLVATCYMPRALGGRLGGAARAAAARHHLRPAVERGQRIHARARAAGPGKQPAVGVPGHHHQPGGVPGHRAVRRSGAAPPPTRASRAPTSSTMRATWTTPPLPWPRRRPRWC